MSKKLYYLPLEPYIERYTSMMSCVNGWAEDHFKKNGVDFVRIDGEQLSTGINAGKVLDCFGRSYYAMSQIMKVTKLLQDGTITDDDVIYVEDFWHPGIESLFYIRAIAERKFKIGTFMHAQSVDDSDFCWALRDWMRPIEQGFAKQYDYIFVTSPILKQLCLDAGVGADENIHMVFGLQYNSTRLLEQLVSIGFDKNYKKEDYVIFSSRFDDEKNPMFFLDVVEACPDIQFRLVNPRKTISYNPEVVERLYSIINRENSNLQIIDTSKNKIDYYTALAKAKVQLNTARQDFFSWTAIEASHFECLPLYPKHKDFPMVFRNDERYLYNNENLDDCVTKLNKLMATGLAGDTSYVVEQCDQTWSTYLKIMGLI